MLWQALLQMLKEACEPSQCFEHNGHWFTESEPANSEALQEL
jgi:hypothetical protein